MVFSVFKNTNKTGPILLMPLNRFTHIKLTITVNNKARLTAFANFVALLGLIPAGLL